MSSDKPVQKRSMRWWAIGVGKGLAALVIVYVPLAAFGAHYRIVYDSVKGANCLPYTVFLVDIDDRSVGRGDYVAFISRQMEPFYGDGTAVVKIAVGVPGDHVRVDSEGVMVNDRNWGTLRHLERGQKLWSMGRRLSDVERDEVVPAGHLWMMGTHPRSYDSRYWGFIKYEQVVGRAIPLW